MTPIPAEAMPVVEVLRRDVKRPEELPKGTRPGYPLRWVWPVDTRCNCCPMGLAPGMTCEVPVESFAKAYGCDEAAAISFSCWWDFLSEADAAAAVEAIWPGGGE